MRRAQTGTKLDVRFLLLIRFLGAGAAIASGPTQASSLALDPFLSPSPEPLDSPSVLSLTNDSFGPGPVNEWDDLDSFGLRFSMPLGPARVLAATSGLTDRTNGQSEGSRIDQASIGAAILVFPRAPAWLSVGAGLDATGNFGGLLIQEALHSGTGVKRPVPTGYSGGLAVSPLGFFKLFLGTDLPLSPYLAVAGRASIPSRASMLGVAGIRYSRPGTLLAIDGGWRAAGGTAPSTLAAVDAAENGPYLGFEFRVGLLALAFEDSPIMRKTNGSLGFVLGLPRSSADPGPLALDLGLLVGSSLAQRVRLAGTILGNRKGLYGEASFSFAQGWFSSYHADATDTMYAEYSLVGSAGLPFADGLAHLDIGLGPFVGLEQLSTVTPVRSIPLGERDVLGAVAESGIRVKFPVKDVPLGLGWRVRWRPLQFVLAQSGDPFSARGSIDFELFLFSED